jgi:nickel/cobalt transporter (NicO) family protein
MMRSAPYLVAGLVAALAVWSVWTGPLAGPVQAALRPLGLWLLQMQREFQTSLALELRGLATGQTAAIWGLMGACLAYGFLHAAGPGHGKAVLAAWAAARPASARKLAAVGLAAALAQSTLAVALALGLAWAVGLSRARIEALDQGTLAPLALALTGALGLWLVWRGAARLRGSAGPPQRGARAQPLAADGPGPNPGPVPGPVRGPATAMLAAARGGPAPTASAYCADPDCADCGRPHLPDAAAMTRASTPWEIAAVIATAAIRPCSGALLVLLLAWQMGILWVGVLGTYAMGLGTAGVTVTLALAARLGRRGLLRAADGPTGPRIAAGIEVLTGALLVVAAASVLTALR